MATSKVVSAAPGSLGLILKDHSQGMEICDVLSTCPFKNEVKSGDIITFITYDKNKHYTSVKDLSLISPDSSSRSCHIFSRNNKKRKRNGFCPIHEVKVPAGSLGLRLNAKHVVLEIMPTSSVGDNIHVGDRIISINGRDVRDVDSKTLVQIMVETSKSERFVGIQPKRKSGRIAAKSPPSPGRVTETQADTKTKPEKAAPPPPTTPKLALQRYKRQKMAESSGKDGGAEGSDPGEDTDESSDEETDKNTNTPQSPPVDLPYKLEDLPSALRNLPTPTTPYVRGTLNCPGERLAVKKAILEACTWHDSIKKLESVVPQIEDCKLAHTSVSALIEAQKRKRDAILEFEEAKLTIFERDLRVLVKYKMEHGNFDDIKIHKKDDEVSRIARRWSRNYKKSQDDKEKAREGSRRSVWHKMRDENIRILEGLGLDLNPPVKNLHPFGNWDDILERLKNFKEENGHCRVPQLYKDEDGCNLGNWVSSQRKDYEKWCCRKTTPMTLDRIFKLEALGFEWKLRYGRPKKHEKRFRNKRMGVGYDAPEEEEDKDSDASDGDDASKTDTPEEDKVRQRHADTAIDGESKLDEPEEENDSHVGLDEAGEVDAFEGERGNDNSQGAFINEGVFNS